MFKNKFFSLSISIICGIISFIGNNAANAEAMNRNILGQMTRLNGENYVSKPNEKAIIFWDKNCPPCRVEIINLANDNIAKNLVLAVTSYEQRDRIILNNQKSAFSDIVVIPQSRQTFFRSLGNYSAALPFSLFLDKDKNICDRHAGITTPLLARNKISLCNN
ncbi:MAG: hypothetical protein LCH83_12105 [Proteobacteria bacterium]|nr:hypothetical protein [Pseudomonadota bacterium]